MTKEMQKLFYAAVGKSLTEARNNKNITIAQLAKSSGEQNKTIRWIESGNVCSLHHLVWMKRLLNLNLDEIIENMEGMSEQEVSGSIDDLI